MNSPRDSVEPAPLRAEAALWQGGWALGVGAAAAAMLSVFGFLPALPAMALALAAVPGALGYFWNPVDRRRYGLLGLWAVAVAGSATLTGGAAGPFVAWCVAPLLVGVLLNAAPQGLALSAGALAAVVLLQAAGFAAPPETGAVGMALTAIGLLMLFAGLAGMAHLIFRSVRDQRIGLEAEKLWFEGVLAEAPYLGAAMDREGRPEAVFGTAPAGLDPDRLAEGLVGAAEPADRPAIYAAICEALDHGAGEADFSPVGAPERRLRVAMRRRGGDGLSAVLHEIGGPAAAAGQEPAGDRLSALEAELEAARGALAAAEEAKAQAEAGAAAKSRFLANMSHELRTPLNAIMGFSDIMRARMFGELAPKYGEYADLIHESGRHLLDLIADVLDMSKIEAERYVLLREVFDVRDAVNAALRLVRLQADESGVHLRGRLSAEPLHVEADRRAIKQIVLNLVSNALKFTPRGGSVAVAVQARGDELEIVVADTGTGIAPEDLERLGRPFEQAGDAEHRTQGTGLGLSLVKAFADLHGGSMQIESALGAGTAVTVRLPVIAASAPAAANGEAGTPSEGPNPAAEPTDSEPGAAPDEPEALAAPQAPEASAADADAEEDGLRPAGTVIHLPFSRQS